MYKKILTVAILGTTSLGLSQGAIADWQSGGCSGSGPCVQLNGGTPSPAYFTSADPTGSALWHGYPGKGSPDGTADSTAPDADPFVFSGSTTLTCNGVPLQCDLSLKGYVNITPGNPDLVGIKVVDFQVEPGDALCSLVTVSGFPWYMAENSEDKPWLNPGLPYDSNNTSPIDLIGSIGPIGVSVPLFANFSNGTMYDVTYNNTNTFSFGGDGADPNIYVNGQPTGCSVSGDLVLQAPGTSLTIH